MSLDHKVFIYGTLKRGQPNHHYMADSNEDGVGRFVCMGFTKEQYPLVVAGPFNTPFCLNKPGWGQHIRGEVWEMDAQLLATLDRLEQVPHLYRRLSRVIRLEDGSDLEVQIYQLCDYKESLLDLPCLSDYDSEGSSNALYIPPNMRDGMSARSQDEVLKSRDDSNERVGS